MKLLNSFVAGKEPLWKAFLLGLLINFTVGFSLALLIQATSIDPLLLRISLAFGLVISMLAWVGQWRCAFNTKYFYLGALLRVWLLVGLVATVGNLLPVLPNWVRSTVSMLILGLIVFAFAYYFIAPVRDFIRLEIYKRKSK